MQDVGWSLRGPEVSRCPRRTIAGSHRTPAPVFVALASAVGFGFALASAVGLAVTREWQPRDGMPVRCLRGPLPVQ
jgi:hypothetical protein